MSTVSKKFSLPWKTIGSVLFLVSLVPALFIPYIDADGITWDGYTFLRETYDGAMPWGHLESHRPFRTISWNIACFLGNYSKTGLQALAAAFHLICSLQVYAIVTLLVPNRPSIAIAAGALRLTWTTALLEGMEDFIHEALFPEVLFVTATLLLVIIERKSFSTSKVWLIRAVIAMLLYLAMGMYESVWVNILLLPFVLLFTGAFSVKNKQTLISLLIWMGTAFAFLTTYFLYFNKFGRLPTSMEPFEVYVDIWISFTRVISVDTIEILGESIGRIVSSFWVIIPILTTVTFCFLMRSAGSQETRSDDSQNIPLRAFLASLAWCAFGYVHIVIGLANTYGNTVAWGSRFPISLSYPVVMLTVSSFYLLFSKVRDPLSKRLFVTAMGTCFFANNSAMVDGWNTHLSRSKGYVGYWVEEIAKGLTKAVPSVKPGTVIIIDGELDRLLTPYTADHEVSSERTMTLHRRNVYGVEDLFIFHNAEFYPLEERADGFTTETHLIYPMPERFPGTYLGIGNGARYFLPGQWIDQTPDGPKMRPIKIAKEKVIWLDYRDRVFTVVEEKSNLDRIVRELNPLHKRMLGIDESFIADE